MNTQHRIPLLNFGTDYTSVGFENIAGWKQDDHLAAFGVFCRSAENLHSNSDHHRQSGDLQSSLIECARRAQRMTAPCQRSAREFFESNFIPHIAGGTNSESGFVTGYYEPIFDASLLPDHDYKYPLYKRPQDLIDLTNTNRPIAMDPSFEFGRMDKGQVGVYYQRGEIQNGVLEGRNFELAWLKDKTDVYFIHVQGSARLSLPGHKTMRVSYDAKTGHAYTSLGKILSQRLGVEPREMTADRLADWMRSHPDDIDELMAQNRSYIFFKHEECLDENDGPIGAAKVALTAGRSLAVDHRLYPYGLPIWLTTPSGIAGMGESTARLMVAQDTGSAIRGVERGDIFVGTGVAAGTIAGQIQSPAHFTLLVPAP